VFHRRIKPLTPDSAEVDFILFKFCLIFKFLCLRTCAEVTILFSFQHWWLYLKSGQSWYKTHKTFDPPKSWEKLSLWSVWVKTSEEWMSYRKELLYIYLLFSLFFSLPSQFDESLSH
jgi:hypothetical protein